MRMMNKVIILVVLLTLMIGSFSFAESKNEPWYIPMIRNITKWIPNTSGAFLDKVFPRAEEIYLGKIYNRSDHDPRTNEIVYTTIVEEPSPFLFSFADNNIFGVYTARAYPLFKFLAIIIISPTITLVGVGFLGAKSGESKKAAWDRAKYLILSVLVLWFLPDILNFILEAKEDIAIGINRLFSTSGTGFIGDMKEMAENGGIMDAVIYLGANIFSVWLMANYIGLTFGFSILFLYTPIALVLTPAKFGRKMFADFGKDYAGYMLTPLLDITLLGVVSIIRSVEVPGLSDLLYNVFTVTIIMFVIPVRSKLKNKLGFGSTMGDMLGAGLAVGAIAMMQRGFRKRPSTSKAGSGGSSSTTTSSTQAEESTDSGSSYNETQPELNDITSAEVPDLGDIGGSDKQGVFQRMANSKPGKLVQKAASSKPARATGAAMKKYAPSYSMKAVKVAGGAYGGFVGATSQMFLGPAAMAAGAYGGAMLGSKGAEAVVRGTGKSAGFAAKKSFQGAQWAYGKYKGNKSMGETGEQTAESIWLENEMQTSEYGSINSQESAQARNLNVGSEMATQDQAKINDLPGQTKKDIHQKAEGISNSIKDRIHESIEIAKQNASFEEQGRIYNNYGMTDIAQKNIAERHKNLDKIQVEMSTTADVSIKKSSSMIQDTIDSNTAGLSTEEKLNHNYGQYDEMLKGATYEALDAAFERGKELNFDMEELIRNKSQHQ